jgi:hypothetical protein
MPREKIGLVRGGIRMLPPDWGFRGFPQYARSTLKLSPDRFLLNPFQFIIRVSSSHSMLYSLSYWKKALLDKQTMKQIIQIL